MTCHEENKIESHHLEIVEITTFHITKIDFLKRYAKAWTFKKNGNMVSGTLQILSCFCQKRSQISTIQMDSTRLKEGQSPCKVRIYTTLNTIILFHCLYCITHVIGKRQQNVVVRDHIEILQFLLHFPFT
jgi:hypothetical protein